VRDIAKGDDTNRSRRTKYSQPPDEIHLPKLQGECLGEPDLVLICGDCKTAVVVAADALLKRSGAPVRGASLHAGDKTLVMTPRG
jgi:hypothetical protein